MATAKRHKLEVGEDAKFQEFSWKAQRAGLALIALFLLSGVLGVLGGGGVFARAREESGPVAVDLERFPRYQTQTELEITFPAAAGPGGSRLLLGREFLQRVRIDQMFPPPSGVEVTTSDYAFSFAAPTGIGKTTLRILYTPENIGSLHGTVTVGARTIRFSQFTLP